MCHPHALLHQAEVDEEAAGPLAQIGRQAGEALDERLAGSRASFLQGIGVFFGSFAGRRAELALEESAQNGDLEARLASMRQRLHNIRARLAQERAQDEANGRRPKASTGSDGLTPREILGFAEGATLTEAQVKKRWRELAKIYHPDVNNGLTGPMQRINDAANAVLSEL